MEKLFRFERYVLEERNYLKLYTDTLSIQGDSGGRKERGKKEAGIVKEGREKEYEEHKVMHLKQNVVKATTGLGVCLQL